MNIVWWLLVGLIAGFVARALVPGRDAIGVLGTIVLGIVGSLVGGFIGSLFYEGKADFQPSGLIGSIIGAIIALLVYRAATGRRGAAV
ncbi:MAG: GlsB/YeaQ/YmgE family stress response membrane protein [Actinomycetota bacterium]